MEVTKQQQKQKKLYSKVLIQENFVIQVIAARSDSIARCGCVNSKAESYTAGQLSQTGCPCCGRFAQFHGFFKSFLSPWSPVMPCSGGRQFPALESVLVALRTTSTTSEKIKLVLLSLLFPQLLLK